jgi:hypothetical protein
VLTPGVLAELEVDALTALHVRHALVGQRIQVTRTPIDVTVQGLVEGRDRHELVRALRELPHGAALLVNLSTSADLMGTRAAGTPPSSSLRAVALGRNAIPAADDLRRAVVSRDAGAVANVEAEMHRIANDGLRHARAAFLEAATLRTLTERFDAARASEIPDTTSRKWRALLTEQVQRVSRGVDQVRSVLEPVFMPYAERTARPAPFVADPRGLSDEARRIAEDLGQVEQATRAALAVAETAPIAIELRDRAFWQRLAATRDRIAALAHQLTSR